MRSDLINRRAALRTLALGGAGAAVLPAWVEALCSVAADRTAPRQPSSAPAWVPAALAPHQNETVILLSELIIPRTDTPGAAAARVNEFIDAVLADAEAPEREQFLRGLEWLDARSREAHGAAFVQLTAPQQTALLTAISAPGAAAPADRLGVEFFQAIKTLTVTGYYTSRVGMREELGDGGRLVFPDYAGCVHPEHQGDAPGRPSDRREPHRDG